MTLEYLEDGDREDFEDGVRALPLLVLHGGDISERAELHRIFQALAAGTTSVVRLHELPFVNNPGGITFTAVSADVDFGVKEDKSTSTFQWPTFQWQRSQEAWSHIAMLMEPFLERGGGFQYLNEDAQGPEVIYSFDGSW